MFTRCAGSVLVHHLMCFIFITFKYINHVSNIRVNYHLQFDPASYFECANILSQSIDETPMLMRLFFSLSRFSIYGANFSLRLLSLRMTDYPCYCHLCLTRVATDSLNIVSGILASHSLLHRW